MRNTHTCTEVETLVYQASALLRALLEANAQAQKQQDAGRLMRVIRVSDRANARYWRRCGMRETIRIGTICSVFAIPADVWK